MGNPPFSKNVKKIVVIMTIKIMSLVFYENRNFAISDDWAEKNWVAHFTRRWPNYMVICINGMTHVVILRNVRL